jgi:hypothetical protein
LLFAFVSIGETILFTELQSKRKLQIYEKFSSEFVTYRF